MFANPFGVNMIRRQLIDVQKFQDLEEERLDFTKSSLWTFANVASTVCVSDDAVSDSLHKGKQR